MSGGPYQAGNQVVCYFAFLTRDLTQAELATFLAGGGLPAGAGVDQTTVLFDYTINAGAVITLTGTSVVHDSTGAYHATVVAKQSGVYEYRGYSVDALGNPVASTSKQKFTVVQFP